MSHRNSQIQKARRRTAKLFRIPTDRYIDLVTWLMDRGYAKTAGDARRLIKMGAVRHESHKLGVDEIIQGPANDRMMSHMRLYGDPKVPAYLRPNLEVVIPEEALDG